MILRSRKIFEITGIDVTATAIPMIIDSESGLLLGPAYELKSYSLETPTPMRNGRIVAPRRNATAERLCPRLNVPYHSAPEMDKKKSHPSKDSDGGRWASGGG